MPFNRSASESCFLLQTTCPSPSYSSKNIQAPNMAVSTCETNIPRFIQTLLKFFPNPTVCLNCRYGALSPVSLSMTQSRHSLVISASNWGELSCESGTHLWLPGMEKNRSKVMQNLEPWAYNTSNFQKDQGYIFYDFLKLNRYFTKFSWSLTVGNDRIRRFVALLQFHWRAIFEMINFNFTERNRSHLQNPSVDIKHNICNIFKHHCQHCSIRTSKPEARPFIPTDAIVVMALTCFHRKTFRRWNIYSIFFDLRYQLMSYVLLQPKVTVI